ncbi:phage tail protein [Microbacterium fluvii]|uniref:Phage tail protein n=1 Tax=Microbacterium fluvii TaxID=415215 RepID=A0ABW2HDR9_9MICO|nr:tail fiber protein [Microbacterium fluvii]MCU4672848.1 tail fiber protein [Microbacterium fluvii]
MSTPYVGEIRQFAGNFAPAGWAFCDGSLVQIADNDTLFQLIGTTYGGDGQTTFALPDLRGRAAIGRGAGPGLSTRTIGETTGVESVTLAVTQLPAHSHVPTAAAAAGSNSAAGAVWAAQPTDAFSPATPGAALSPTAISVQGGSQPHDNMPPYVVVNHIISLYGIYPSQT